MKRDLPKSVSQLVAPGLNIDASIIYVFCINVKTALHFLAGITVYNVLFVKLKFYTLNR